MISTSQAFPLIEDENMVHPDTGYHYIHVISDCMSFGDVYRSYKNLAQELPYITTISLREFRDNPTGLLNDPNNVIITWHDDRLITRDRKCKAIIRYSEMITENENIGHQKELLDDYKTNIDNYDYTFVHSKAAEKHIKTITNKVAYLPVGYDPLVYGTPDYNTPKKFDLIAFGSNLGRRIQINENLKKHFGDRFLEISCWDKDRKELLEQSRINLIIPWCRNPSFPAFRMLQSVGTSAAMLTEKTNSHPAKPNKHIIQITDFDDEALTNQEIENALTKDLINISKQAHKDLTTTTAQAMSQLINKTKDIF